MNQAIDRPARYLLTIEECRTILLPYGIRVHCSFPSSYCLRRDLPWYGDAEKRKPLREGFSVSHASLGDVRAMARAYQALDLPRDRDSAEHCRRILRDAWATYTAARVHLESLGTPPAESNDWALRNDPPEDLKRLQARGSERAHWHTHRVWQENVRDRLSEISAQISGVAV